MFWVLVVVLDTIFVMEVSIVDGFHMGGLLLANVLKFAENGLEICRKWFEMAVSCGFEKGVYCIC